MHFSRVPLDLFLGLIACLLLVALIESGQRRDLPRKFLAARFKEYSDDHVGWSKEIWDMAPVGWLINPEWAQQVLAPTPSTQRSISGTVLCRWDVTPMQGIKTSGAPLSKQHLRAAHVLPQVELARVGPLEGVTAEPDDDDLVGDVGGGDKRGGDIRDRGDCDDAERVVRTARPRAGDEVVDRFGLQRLFGGTNERRARP